MGEPAGTAGMEHGKRPSRSTGNPRTPGTESLTSDNLRRLLGELHDADRDRLAAPRGSRKHAEAGDRVDEAIRAIWEHERPEPGDEPPVQDEDPG